MTLDDAPLHEAFGIDSGPTVDFLDAGGFNDIDARAEFDLPRRCTYDRRG